MWGWYVLTRELGHGSIGFLFWCKISSGSSFLPLTQFSSTSAQTEKWGAELEIALPLGQDLGSREVAQEECSSRVPWFCCSGKQAEESFCLWTGNDRLVSISFKNQVPLSCSLAFHHLLHFSVPMSHTPVAIVCFLPTSLFTLSEERGDGSTFFPSSSPDKKPLNK